MPDKVINSGGGIVELIFVQAVRDTFDGAVEPGFNPLVGKGILRCSGAVFIIVFQISKREF